jgi:hypothetical protein
MQVVLLETNLEIYNFKQTVQVLPLVRSFNYEY